MLSAENAKRFFCSWAGGDLLHNFCGHAPAFHLGGIDAEKSRETNGLIGGRKSLAKLSFAQVRQMHLNRPGHFP
jgi:hypothetical protein